MDTSPLRFLDFDSAVCLQEAVRRAICQEAIKFHQNLPCYSEGTGLWASGPIHAARIPALLPWYRWEERGARVERYPNFQTHMSKAALAEQMRLMRERHTTVAQRRGCRRSPSWPESFDLLPKFGHVQRRIDTLRHYEL